MPNNLHDVRFPGESDRYRESRDQLLKAELELRGQLENVAAMRRKLPLGGAVNTDYVFEEIIDGSVRQTRLADLFENGKQTLVIYSYMFGPDDGAPCPMCTSLLDGLESQATHITQRTNLAVVGKSPAGRLHDWAASRGWTILRLLSSHGNSYNTDYHAEKNGQQLPALNVFTRTTDGIFHTYATEGLYVEQDGQPRHVDLIWPLWNVFDLTPEGRGQDWYPDLAYE